MLVIGVIGGLIALFTIGEELLLVPEGSWIITAIVVALSILIIIVGVFSAIAATRTLRDLQHTLAMVRRRIVAVTCLS